MPKRQYRTKQRELVLDCLRRHADAYLTAKQVEDELQRQGSAVGLATVYRNLERLEEDGLVARSTVGGTGGVCFRLLSEAPAHSRFYLKCESCGRMEPVGCSEIGGLYDHISREHHVRIDPVKTVLFGTCSTCLDGGPLPPEDARPEGARPVAGIERAEIEGAGSAAGGGEEAEGEESDPERPNDNAQVNG